MADIRLRRLTEVSALVLAGHVRVCVWSDTCMCQATNECVRVMSSSFVVLTAFQHLSGLVKKVPAGYLDRGLTQHPHLPQDVSLCPRMSVSLCSQQQWEC